MGNWSFNGTFTTVPDPDFQSFGMPKRGNFIGGKVIYQGWESGQFTFPPLESASWIEIRQRWEANSGVHITGTVPRLNGAGWQSASAWYREPVPTGFDGPIVLGVTMVLERIIRWG